MKVRFVTVLFGVVVLGAFAARPKADPTQARRGGAQENKTKVIEAVPGTVTNTASVSERQIPGTELHRPSHQEVTRSNAPPAAMVFLGYSESGAQRLARFELRNDGDMFSQFSGPGIQVWNGSSWQNYGFDRGKMAMLGRSRPFRPVQVVTVPVPSNPLRWRATVSVQGRSSGNYSLHWDNAGRSKP